MTESWRHAWTAARSAVVVAGVVLASHAPQAEAGPPTMLVREGECTGAATLRGTGLDAISPGEIAWLPWTVGTGPYRIQATMVLERYATEGAGLAIAGGVLGLDDPEHDLVPRGGRFGPPAPLSELRAVPARSGVPMQVVAQWDGKKLRVALNGIDVGAITLDAAHGRIGLAGPSAAIRLVECTIDGPVQRVPVPTIVFSAADGPIDEYRDPVACAGPDSIEILAMAVTTRDDGTLDQAIRRRSLRDGVLGPSLAIEVGGLKPGRVTMGHDGTEWILLVQPTSTDGMSTSIEVFRSLDALAWERAAVVDAGATPIRLVTAGMRRHGTNGIEAAATRLVHGVPRACVVRGAGASWSIHDLSTAPSCDPVWVGADEASMRVPRQAQRWITPGTTPVACPSMALPLWLDIAGGSYLLGEGPRNDRLVLAAAMTGAVEWSAWDGPVGTVCGASIRNETWAVFEGGLRAPREHVLLMRLPR